MVVGDTHGSGDAIIKAANIAGKRRIAQIIICGDFGLWTHWADGQEFLDTCNQAAEGNNLSIYAIGGNHENWDHWNWMVENFPTHKGFAMARRRVLLAPKAHSWRWAKKQFIGAGGAVSVDREVRLARERGGNQRDPYAFPPGATVNFGRGTGLRTQWWPNEQFTDADVETIRGMGLKADYLFTHDCSNNTEWGRRLKPDIDSEVHRKRIDEVIKITQAGMHFHGHMHERYEWDNARSHGFYSADEEGAVVTRTRGLNMAGPFERKNMNTPVDSWGVLDTDKDEFKFGFQIELEELSQDDSPPIILDDNF